MTASLVSDGATHSQQSFHRIKSTEGHFSLNFREIWAYRGLLYFLIWRDVKVRYKQTALGAAWAIIAPLTTVLVFSVFFGRVAKIPSDGIPYPLFSFSAMVPWTFFATGLNSSANSMVSSANLLTKVYFPRLCIPIASVLAASIDFVVALLALFVMMAAYRVVPSARLCALPLFFLLAVVTALGAGLWFAAINVRYRDVKFLVPFLTQVWLFATPIAYPSSLLHEPWRTVYAVNPMVGVVEGFRWSLLRSDSASALQFLISTLIAICLLASGVFVFRKMERTFADFV